ncbi:homoserine dehydrogenase [Variovorax sp. J22R133]|uniref:homoserine dehydrogenase n=1 Tax=Variovorax brevis TaxID=3053503 RepID=UPI002577C1D3|nr:homoserine dehydrogenase [Variovorax sp. J22R133]MDM0111449.1 homoserine dehydrogenase [Variovorax sp. J22R133]
MYRDLAPSLQPQRLHAGTPTRALHVGMIGIGTVGTGIARVLLRNQAEIAGRAGRGIELVAVAARNLPRAAGLVGSNAAAVEITGDPLRVATHPDVDVVVEVAGGTVAPRDWALAAINNGKHWVTANKALLAMHGTQILAAARRQGVAVAYEGAVAGSIPIVKTLREGLTANRIEWVAGIINGTTNFILSKMRDEGLGFAEALAQAQAMGYAEADPAFDIEGIDAAHKLALLAANAFGMSIRFADTQVEGITALDGLDVACAEQLGYRIKLLGIARRRANGVELRVQPALLPASHLLAQVNGSMNGVMVKGDASGVTLYCGAGAGSEQTASAVIADLVDIARQGRISPAQRVPHLGFQAEALRPLPVLRREGVRTSHYLRVPLQVEADAEPVAQWLKAQGLPVRHSELVKAQPDGAPQLLVLTNAAMQDAVDRVLQSLAAQPGVAGAATTLRVEDWAC